MLSPYATLFYPITDNLQCEIYTTEKEKDEQSTNESSIQKGQTKNKDTIKKQQNIHIPDNNIKAEKIIETIKENQIQVQNQGDKRNNKQEKKY